MCVDLLYIVYRIGIGNVKGEHPLLYLRRKHVLLIEKEMMGSLAISGQDKMVVAPSQVVPTMSDNPNQDISSTVLLVVPTSAICV
jgi:hypothetical protein